MATAVNYFWIGDRRSDEVGIVMRNDPVISALKPRVETFSVSGRNGDLHIYDGSYENRHCGVSAYIYNGDGVIRDFSRLHEFLFANKGYQRISFEGDLDHYWLGRIVNGAEISLRLGKLAPFDIEMDFKPQHFLADGEEPIEISSDAVGEITEITNPTYQAARPIYKVYFSTMGMTTNGTVDGKDSYIGWLTVNNTSNGSIAGEPLVQTLERGNTIRYTVTVVGGLPPISGYFYYDSEIENVIFDPTKNLTQSGGIDINLIEFDFLMPPQGIGLDVGTSEVRFRGYVSGESGAASITEKVEITPRWWEL